MKPKKDWSKFNKMHMENFWAIVTPQGHWVDSAMSYEIAVELAAQHEIGEGAVNLNQALEFFRSKSLKPYYGVSIIHSTMLHNLYEMTDFLIEERNL